MISISRTRDARPERVTNCSGALDFPLRNIGLLLCFFALLKPSLFDLNSYVTLACRIFAVFVFAWVVYGYARDKTRLSSPLVFFVAFRVSMLIPTLLNDGDVLNWGYTTVSQVALFGLIEREMRFDRRRAVDCLGVLRVLLLAYLVINCFMVFSDVGTVQRAMADGEITKWYLLGIRTRVTDCLFPALMISMVLDACRGKRIGVVTLFVLAIGLAQIVYLEVATAMVGLVVLAVGFVAMRFSKNVRRLFSVRNILMFGMVFTTLIVVFRVQNGFSDLLGSLLGKSVTLTGRTEVWDIAFGIIAASPFFGYGVNDGVGAFVPWRGMYWQSHNQWVQLLYDGGIVAVGLFVVFVLSCGHSIDRGRVSDRVASPMKAVLLAFMVMMASEIYTYNMGLFFLIPFVMAEILHLERGCNGPGERYSDFTQVYGKVRST